VLVFDSVRGSRQPPQNVKEGYGILEALSIPPLPRILEILVIIGALVGLWASIVLLQSARSNGVSINNIGDLAKLPAYYSALRYTAGIEKAVPTSIQYYVLILDAGAIAGGLLRTFKTTWYQQIFQLLPLGFALLLTLTTGARSYLFVDCTWFFGSLIAVLCVQGTIFKQLRSPRFLLKAGALLIIAFLFGSSFALLRYAARTLQTPTLAQFWTQLAPTMAASLAAIVTATLIFNQVTHVGVPLHLAAYTFAPIMSRLGLEAVRYPPDIYLTSGLSDSNQYALVGYLLMDFGPFITALIFFLTGLLAAATVRLVRAGVLSFLPLLIAIMCVILFSLIHNFFFFTTHVLLFIGMTLAVIILRRLQSQPTQI
jgi:hypothetical protein